MVEGGNGQGNGFNSDAFVNSLRVAMTPLFDGLRKEFREDIQGLRTELTGKLDEVKVELKGEIRVLGERLQAHVEGSNQVLQRIDRLEDRVGVLERRSR